MITDDELDQLRYKGEGADLDFKQAQYPFVNVSDHQKSELLKDILAMANAYRSGPGRILIGFKDQSPHPAEVTGISETDHIDDAALQQFIRSKVEPVLEFQYEEKIYQSKHVAYFTIPVQMRPFASNRDYGKVRKNTVYVRRGSSTDEATPSEVVKMGLGDIGTRQLALEVRVLGPDNLPLAELVQLRFLEVGELPDYDEDSWMEMPGGRHMRVPTFAQVNRDFFREAAEYYFQHGRAVVVRLSVTNNSDVALEELKFEVTCTPPTDGSVGMVCADELPLFPRRRDSVHYAAFRGMRSATSQVSVDNRSGAPVCSMMLGTLRPGESGLAEEDLALLPDAPGEYKLRVRILAKEIPKPIVSERSLLVEGEVSALGIDELEEILEGPRDG